MRTISELAPNIEYVSRFDEEIGALMGDELRRQRRNIELIASENIASAAVRKRPLPSRWKSPFRR